MNNFDPLTRALERNPGNDIVASMLVDALMEEKDMTRTEADRVVTDVRRAGLDAAQMADAAELMKAGAPNRAQLLDAILDSLVQPVTRYQSILLIPGEDAPQEHRGRYTSQRFAGIPSVITVGAGWVMNWETVRLSNRKLGRRRKRVVPGFED